MTRILLLRTSCAALTFAAAGLGGCSRSGSNSGMHMSRAANAASMSPPADYQKVSSLVKLPDFLPGLGSLDVQPSTLPAGPFLAYDRNGVLVSTIYMIPLEDMQAQKKFADLAVGPDETVKSVSMYYNAGHPGVEKPQYHIVLWHVPESQAKSTSMPTRRRLVLAGGAFLLAPRRCAAGARRSGNGRGAAAQRLLRRPASASTRSGLRWLLGRPFAALVEANVHTTTAYHPANGGRPLRIPEHAAPWDSDYLVEPGQTFEVMLAAEAVYDYFCTPHEIAGMVGRIIVGTAWRAGRRPAGRGDSRL